MKKFITSVVIIIILIALAILLSVQHAPLKNSAGDVSDPIAIADYACDAGKTIQAVYYDGTTTPSIDGKTPPVPGGSVAVTLSDGRTMKLHQTLSADGARYADAKESFVFWNKGNGVMVLENGSQTSYKNCISK